MGSLVPRHRLVAQLALWSGGVYLLWRGGLTLQGADPAAAAVVIAAEVLGLAVYASRVWASTGEPVGWVDVPDAPLPDTTAVVDATEATVDELRTTLVSLRRVEGVDRVVVVVADESRWARTVAQRFDAVVGEPGVAVLEAARRAASSWVLILRAGDLPMPDLVTKCAARCSSPAVGIVQVGTREAAPTSFEHESDGRWSLEPFEQEVVRPSLAARGSLPWYADGPAMVRRAVLPPAPAPAAAPREPRLIGLDVTRAGMTVTHVPLILARVRGPDSLGEFLVRRAERLRAALRGVVPALGRDVPRSTTLAHLLGAMPVVAGIQRLLMVAAAVLVLGFAQTPMVAGSELLVLAVPTYGLRWASHRLLGRGRLEAFSVLRSDIRSLAVDVVPARFSSTTAARLGVGAVGAIIVVLHGAVLVAGFALWHDWDRGLSAETTAVALALTAGYVGVAMEVMLDVLGRCQERKTHRVRLGLVTCRVEEHDGQLVDLSMGGVGVSLPCSPIEAPAPGSVTTIAFRIPDADGAWRSVSALVHVAHRRADPEGGTRLGLAFDDPTDAPLDPVVEFLTVDRRPAALEQREPLVG